MREAIALFLACVLALGYEIRHENEGKIYKFAGEADGSKFELYISELEVEFENFSDKGVVLPPKFQGHAFFEGSLSHSVLNFASFAARDFLLFCANLGA